MLDIRRIRNEPDVVKASMARRGVDVADVDRVLDLDARRRELATARDALRAEIKEVSREVGRHKGSGDAAAAETAAARSRELGEQEKARADEEGVVAEELHQLLLRIPNVIHDDAPMVPLFHSTQLVVFRKEVENFVVSPMSDMLFERVRLADPATREKP